MSRRRQLSEEERKLWANLASAVTPLRRAAKGRKTSTPPTTLPGVIAPAEPNGVRPTRTDAVVSRPAKLPASPAPPLASLERRLKQRVARGRDPIDARIDLHGMTQTQAHAAVLGFLLRAQADGARLVLIVTGKGSTRRDGSDGHGVLRRQVPIWLTLPEFRPLIVGFDDAHANHGGEGALYVRVRRGRRGER